MRSRVPSASVPLPLPLPLILALGLGALAFAPDPAPAQDEDDFPFLEDAPVDNDPPDDDVDVDGDGVPERSTDDSTEAYLKALDLQRKRKWRSAQKAFQKMLKKHPESVHKEDALNRSEPNHFAGVTVIHESGPSSRRIDVAVMGDGFTHEKSSQKKQEDWAELCLDVLWSEASFEEYKDYFNYYFVRLVSEDVTVHPLTACEPQRARGSGTMTGGSAPVRCAATESARKSKTWSPRRRSVAAAVNTRSAKRSPRADWLPKEPLRQSTALRTARSAALFVGLTSWVRA